MISTEEARLKIKEINQWVSDECTKPEMYIADEVISFDADFGRIGIIWIGNRQECVACKSVKECLVVDQSEGEYSQAVICFDCIELIKLATKGVQYGKD